MKAVTFAAAAALVGSAAAGQNAHERLHKREDWPTTTSTDPGDWTTTSSSTTTSSTGFTDWDPTSTSTTTSGWDWTTSSSISTTSTTSGWDWTTSSTTSADPTWVEWDPKASSTTKSKSTGTWGEWDPKASTTTKSKSTETWGEWDPVDPTDSCTATVTDWALGLVTSTAVVTATETDAWVWSWGVYTETTTITVTSVWGWGSSTSSTPVAAFSTSSSSWAWPYDPSVCSVTVVTSTGAPQWLPDPSWTSVSTVYVTPVAAAVTTGWPAWTTSADPSTETEWAWGSSSSSTTTAESSTWAWTSTSSSATATGTGHAPIAPVGNSWAMTYSPYTATSGCKDQGTISADIAIIASKGFTSVRVYSTDCSTLEFVGQACRDNGLKMILGIFISSTGINGASQQVTDILAWAQWDIVELIVVGNEAVFNGYCSASDLAWFISSVKGQCSGAGYTGPVTTTEPLTTWQTSGTTFCSAVDVVAANLYAFFNAETTCDQAGTFIESEITILEGICSGLDVYVMETGWPTAGECNGAACPGFSEQATAITAIQETSGAKVVFFSYEDDEWKQPGTFGVEQHWGCVNVFATTSSATGW